MPCVSHGTCCANQVVGAGAGGITGAFGGTAPCGTAPLGKSVVAADGTTLGAAAAAANKRAFNFL